MNLWPCSRGILKNTHPPPPIHCSKSFMITHLNSETASKVNEDASVKNKNTLLRHRGYFSNFGECLNGF